MCHTRLATVTGLLFAAATWLWIMRVARQSVASQLPRGSSVGGVESSGLEILRRAAAAALAPCSAGEAQACRAVASRGPLTRPAHGGLTTTVNRRMYEALHVELASVETSVQRDVVAFDS